jgi:hypothetical protein
MKRFFLFLLVLSFIGISTCNLLAATQTINTVPSANATFITDVQTFLEQENADRDTLRGNNNVISGGLSPTSANLTATITEIIAFPNGFYVTQAATSHTYTASKRTFVYVRDDDSRTITISGATITYDSYLVFAETTASTEIPDTPTGTILLFYADTSGAAITSVVDLRSGFVNVNNFDDLEDAADNVGANQAIVISDVQNVGTKTITQDIWVMPGGRVIVDDNATLTTSGDLYVLWGSSTSPPIDGTSTGGNTDTLTVSGDFVAGDSQQVFGSNITVGFSVFVEEVHPEWWTENTTPGTTDMSGAFTSGLTAMATGNTLLLVSSQYKWDSPVTISTSDITMEGGSNQIPKITYTEDDGTAALTLSTGADSNIARVTLRKFRIFGFANGTGTETDGTGISMIDAAYCLLEDIYIEGYRNAGGTGKGLAIYGHNKNTFNRLDIRWCDYGVYTGPNPNTHTTVDMDLFHFEDCIFGGNPDTGGDAGVCVYIDSNYNNNLSFTGQTEFSSCKTGVYLDAAISPNFNQFLIQGGRFEYTTAVAGGRFLDISPSSGNINNLSIKDFYSPYPIELGGSIGYVTLDNVYLGTDDVGNTTEALITGTTVGPGTVRNSRIVDGYTINGNIIYKKWWGSATKIEEMLWVQAADTNNYEFHNGFQIVEADESAHGGLNINSYGASADIEADASTTIPVAVRY